jgi:hypothetical protein
VQFNPSWAGTGIVYPWLQTQYGSIFTGGSVRQRSIISNLNATYCIFAQQAYNFQSGSCISAIPNIAFKTPQPNTYNPTDFSYRSILGRIDVTGLTATARTINGINYNKFGNIVVPSGEQTWSSEYVLDNKVYHIIGGNLTLASGFKINNGSGLQKGNGTVIIDGDLIINGDFAYSDIIPTDLKQLASVAWVVKGDVIVDGAVTKTVGAFLVLGDPNATCLYDDGAAGSPCSGAIDYPKYKQTHYGIFFSGASSNPLTISGLIVAKAGDFSRTYTNPTRGSEKIIYDGRLIANPPPGLKGLIEAMPLIRDF